MKYCSAKGVRQPDCKTINKSLNRLHNFFYYWFPVLIYCGLIYIQSSFPAPDRLTDFFSFDKTLHFFAYAILGALFLRAFMTTRMKNRLTWLIVLSILSSSLYGISDEIHQHFVPYRNADLLDALMDISGSAFGVYAYQAVKAKYRSYFHD